MFQKFDASSFYWIERFSLFQRGDLLFLTNYQEEDIRVGEIVVFKIDGRDIPIVHRVLKLHEKEDGTIKVNISLILLTLYK
jgi:uncharacterized protein (UPF0248 family)